MMLVYVLFLACIGSTFGATASNPVSTFIINPNTKDSVTVKLVTDEIAVSCRLDYDTTAVGETNKKSDYLPANTLLEQMTRKYGCLPFNKGIFEYEICLGKEIKQSADNGDNYSLGKYEKIVEGFTSTQTYTKGTFCEAAHTDRKSVIEFTCSDRANVMSIEEHAVCQYRIIIGVPEVCGHPQFTGTVSKVESWLLEVTETDEGAVICQAYNNGFDTIGTMTFASFSLSLNSPKYALSKYVVRNKNRKVVDTSALQMTASPASVTSRNKQIDYVKIVAE